MSLSLVGLFLLHAAGANWPLLQRLENVTYDYRIRATTPGGVDPRVVIVDIDERSLGAEGHWPWRRDKLAELIDKLFDEYMVGILGLDIVFPEYAEDLGLEALDQLAQGALAEDPLFLEQYSRIRENLDQDHLFAESLQDRDVILGYVLHDEGQSNQLPPPTIVVDEFSEAIPFIRQSGYTANLPELHETAYGAGFFYNPEVDQDGVFRRLPLLSRVDEGLYETLALAMIRGLYGQPEIKLGISHSGVEREVNLGLEWVIIGDLKIPVDERGLVMIPYRGPTGSFPYVSATDVLQGAADADLLDGAIVLLGTTAPGLLDMRSTPVQNVFPGVEVHANLISGILDQQIKPRMKARPAYTMAAELVSLVVIGLLMTIVSPYLGPIRGLFFVMLMFGVTIGVNLYFWERQNLLLPLASQLSLVLGLYLLHTVYSFFIEARSKRRLGLLFGQYVPPEIVEEMSARGGSFGLGGESREMTVLFSDVRNFTSISEGLKPDELTALMNAYLTHMTQVIHDSRGTIDKYIGDAIMAFWGAPLPDPQHPLHALNAALRMSEQMERVRSEFRERGWPELRVGIGLNTGLMNVGNMGSEFRMSYTVLGDAVNLGSRLEGLTKNYGVEIIASEFTRNAVEGFLFRELDRVRVKGKDLPVTLYEPVGEEGMVTALDRERLARYEQALEHYRGQQWDPAEASLRLLAQEEPGRKVYGLYLDRIAVLRQEPPGEGWDAVFTYTTK